MKEVKAYQRKVEQAPQKLIEYLTAQGVEIAKMNVSDMNAYDSGELYNSIHAEQKSGVGYVIADAAHAAFVCFGTGIVGKNNQHPNIAIAGWKYDVNDHGELGWWYIGRDGWHTGQRVCHPGRTCITPPSNSGKWSFQRQRRR